MLFMEGSQTVFGPHGNLVAWYDAGNLIASIKN